MKALILNSGEASRLKPLTDNMPKCLLKINGETILGRQLKCLGECGLSEVIVTTGPFEDQIKHFIDEHFPGFRVRYAPNPRFAETNYIYSIWLARDLVDDDIVLLHGDLVFDCSLLKQMLFQKSDNYVAVNKVIPPPHKDFKARVEDNRVREIGINITGEDSYFCPAIYRLSLAVVLRWIDQMGEFIRRGKVTCYAENALNEISGELDIKPFYFSDERCMEIDTFDDLEEAGRLFREGG